MESAGTCRGLAKPIAPATFEWRGPNAAAIRTHLQPGDVVTVQVTYDRGWSAFVNGAPRAIERDGPGAGWWSMPACSGACDIRLVYDGDGKPDFAASAAIAVLLFSWMAGQAKTWKRGGSRGRLDAFT